MYPSTFRKSRNYLLAENYGRAKVITPNPKSEETNPVNHFFDRSHLDSKKQIHSKREKIMFRSKFKFRKKDM